MIGPQAKVWHDLGLAIVPVGEDKQPLIAWKEWQTRPQTEEEFTNAVSKSEESGRYAVICGTKLTNGLYFGVFDLDVKNVSEEAMIKGKEFEDALQKATMMELTPSNGVHFIYYSQAPVKTDNKAHDFCGVEVLGESKLCVMAPSKNYSRLNESGIYTVPSLNLGYDQTLEAIGFEHHQLVDFIDVDRLLNGVGVGERDDAAIKLASYFRKKKLSRGNTLQKLLEWDKKNVEPLGIAVLQQKVESAYKQPQAYNYKFEGEQPETFNPVTFAKVLLSNHQIRTMRDNEEVYVFDEQTGIYKSTGKTIIKEDMAKTLDDETRQRYYQDVLFYIQATTYIDRPHNPFGSVAVQNGILDVRTRELTPFNPEYFITSCLPVKYDKAQDCPRIKKFLSEVVGEEQTTLIQELFGYCLFKAMPQHKAFMLIGDGANGKSKLLGLLKVFLGSENVSNASLQALCFNRFSAAQLYGKLANICADLPSNALTQTGTFKMLTGEDTINAEEKFKQPFSFKNYAKMVFSTNRVPETLDDTPAFFRRWVLVACNNVFIGDKRNPNILEEITTPEELTGLLNYALDGLERLLKNGHFTTPENIDSLRTEYIRKSNSAKAYIEEKLMYVNDSTVFTVKKELYRKYVAYCTLERLLPMQQRQLTIAMQQYMPLAKEKQIRVETKPTWVWQFVREREEQETLPTETPPENIAVTGVTSSQPKHRNDVISGVCHNEVVGNKNKHGVTDVTPIEKFCGECIFWLVPGSCIDDHPELIFKTNTRATTCAKFRPKGEVSYED